MDFLKLVKKRYSAREFSKKTVDEKDLLKILEAGRCAPTAANRQPQKLLVVQSHDGLQKLSRTARIYNAPVVIVVCADTTAAWTRRYDGKQTMDIDASIVTDHMMLMAADLGIDSLWLASFDPAAVRGDFNIPGHLEPVNLLALGYNGGKPSSPDRHDTERKPLEDIVFKESF